jgi:hypothetical protein
VTVTVVCAEEVLCAIGVTPKNPTFSVALEPIIAPFGELYVTCS